MTNYIPLLLRAIATIVVSVCVVACSPGDDARSTPTVRVTSPAVPQEPILPDTQPPASERVHVEIMGGHETVPVDRGRPVILIAGALGVTPDVFRGAFSNVRPAPGGRNPTRERERMNKDVLMRALSPYGITNSRLDEVSNQYRYRPQSGELWPTRPAKIDAVITGDSVQFEIIDGGAGYSSPPTLRIPDQANLNPIVTLHYGEDFLTNGSVEEVVRATL